MRLKLAIEGLSGFPERITLVVQGVNCSGGQPGRTIRRELNWIQRSYPH